ncbi:MAG: PQQ-binding-like beta-propeller repeat protein [Candidatus Bathyarchaeia archaeon]|jgi:hypothetical protein
MQNKKLSIVVTIILLFCMTSTLAFAPSSSAHSPSWTWVSYPYIVAAPNPVGVGQTVAIVFWIDTGLPGAAIGNDVRRHDYSLTITDPDGRVEVKTWPVVSDTTSVQYYQYTPQKIGNYTIKFDYPQQTYTWTGSDYTGDVFLAATKTITLTVQDEPIESPIDSYPLPTEYWTRPIEGQNSFWYSISSNWLGVPFITGAAAAYGIPGAYQPDGLAPNSAHIMWAKSIQHGGVVGGNDTSVPGEMFYGGLSYATRFSNPIIMQGVLYYQEPLGNSGGVGGMSTVGGEYVAVNLLTGKEIWRINCSATGTSLVPTFGYLYSFENPNQHGVLPNGLLIAPTTIGGVQTPYGVMGGTPCWRTYDAVTGYLTDMLITNVPSGASIGGPSGEVLTYVLTNYGNATHPNYYLAQWNSSRVFGGNGAFGVANWYSGTVDASTAACYDWNISLPSLKGSGWSVVKASLGIIPLVREDDKIVLIQGGLGGHPGDFYATISPDNGNMTCIDLRPNNRGAVIWAKSYEPAPGNNSRLITDWDPDAGIFTTCDKESITHDGWSLSDGSHVWGPAEIPDDYTADYNYLAHGLERVAYGKLYFTGYGGIVYAFDVKTGDLLWTYGNGGEGNSTLSGFNTAYGRYPIFISTIADGKIYLDTTEHSPNSPLYKGAMYRCINATTGEELWKIMDYGNQMYGGQAPVADGYLTTLNTYDMRIYCFGKGPSQMTVTAPDVAAPLGTPIIIRGTVTDIAAGTTQDEQAARFPNGVPAVSDESQSAWMEYVYMQKPKPTNVTGVEVTLNVYDSNGNYRPIGVAKTDASGMFTYTWTPDIEGSYLLIANFAGTNSYYPTSAESSFVVSAAAPTPIIEQQVVNMPPIELYVIAMGMAIIIAVAIATLLILRKK